MTRALSPALQTFDLSLSRGGRRLFGDICISLTAGEALLVQGPNASGKSSILRVLAGLLSPSSGTFIIKGSLGWLGHENALAPERTPRTELIFWLGELPQDNITDFGMSVLIDTPIRLLSQGQKRRLALWRLAAGGTDIWLLDEPAAGLDLQNRQHLDAAIQAHLAKGGIVVAAVHEDLEISGAETILLGGGT